MLFKNKYVKTIAALAAVSLLPSCVQLSEDSSEAVGYLTLSGISLDAEITELNPTKAASTTLDALGVSVSEPSLSDVQFTLTGNAKSESWKGEEGKTITLPAGTYTLTAEAGSNGFGSPWFKGETSVTITALETFSASVLMKVSNALLAVSLDEELGEHFTPAEGNSVTISSGSDQHEAAMGTYVFVPSEKALTVSVAGESSAGVSKTFTKALSQQASANTAVSLVLSKDSDNWPSISLADLSGGAFEGSLYFSAAKTSNISEENAAELVYQIKGGSYSDWTEVSTTDAGTYKLISGLTNDAEYTLRATVGNLHSEERTFTPVTFASCIETTASAVHTTNTANELDGTKVTADVTLSLPSIIADIAAVSAVGSFRNSTGEERSTLSVESLKNGSNEIALTNVSGWPYIPKDADCSLTATYTCTLPANRTVTHESSISKIEVPSAQEYFNLKLEAYTSYSLYLDKQIDKANTCQPETLYKPGASWSISTDLMSNSNYLKSLSSSLIPTGSATPVWSVDFPNIEEYDDNSYLENEVTSLDWTSYTLSAELTFAGETVQTQGTYHITGLPYTSAPPTNSGSHPWTIDAENWAGKFSWGSDEFFMYTDSATGTYNRIGTPIFNIPSDFDCTIVVTAHGCRHAAINSDVDIRLYSGDSTYDFTAKYNGNAYSDYTINTLKLYSHSPKIQLEGREFTAYCKLYVKKVTISYR